MRGFLEGGHRRRSEDRPVARLELIDAETLAERLEHGRGPLVLDVRGADEFAAGRIPGSVHIPYGRLPARLAELPAEREIATVCSRGKRSGLAASILQREGFERVVDVGHGGVGTWQRAGRPIEKDDNRLKTQEGAQEVREYSVSSHW